MVRVPTEEGEVMGLFIAHLLHGGPADMAHGSAADCCGFLSDAQILATSRQRWNVSKYLKSGAHKAFDRASAARDDQRRFGDSPGRRLGFRVLCVRSILLSPRPRIGECIADNPLCCLRWGYD